MVILALYTGFFTEAERAALSPLILAVLAAFTLVTPVLAIWIYNKLRLGNIQTQILLAENGAKLDELKHRGKTRANDESDLADSQVRELPEHGANSSERRPGLNAGLKRDASPVELQGGAIDETDNPAGLPSDYRV